MKATSTSPKAKDKLLRLGAVLFWLLIWQLGSMAVNQEILLVSPVSACATLIRLMGESSFYQAVFGSFGRILAGFALSTVLGILLAGCAYVPFLQTNPVKRISYMMQTAGVKIALCGKAALAKLAQEDLPCRCVALDSGAGAPYLPCETGGEELMYVLYTSGSTGQPKGVMLRHQALSNLLGFDESKFKITTGIAGGVGTLLAAFGLLSRFEAFLSLMSALLPPLAGVIIANYWIVSKGRREAFKVQDGVSAPGLSAYLVGAFVACLTGGTFASFSFLAWLNVPFFVGPVNGIIVSLILYVVLAKVMKKNYSEGAATTTSHE